MTTHTPRASTPHLPERYLACWLVLGLLTALTFALSNLELGRWALAAALAIAVSKAAVVALFFMHLWDHPGATRLVLVGAALFVGVLATLVVADVRTRFPSALPRPETAVAPREGVGAGVGEP